jgi:nucleolar protein 56
MDEVVDQTPEVQQSIINFSTFGKMVKLKSFLPFTSAESALENCNDTTEGILNATLKNFLDQAFPSKKRGNATLGVQEEKIGSAIQESLNLRCEKNTQVLELLRGIRLHFAKFVPELQGGGLEKAQLGLGHSYSRAKVKFNVNRVDNMIIQSIALLDQLDKDVNTFSMRCREWYSWHFPELSKIVAEQAVFARLAKQIRNKENLTDDDFPALNQITGDEGKAKEIIEAAKASMGQDISDFDMVNIEKFADRVIELAEYRDKLHQYLLKKMHDIAPNLSALVGEQVGARLIAHAGSLTNLAKLPASTVQILGAEKALFRALKTKGNTPKYGLIYHSSFIGKAGQKNKGRISRYLANKCTIAARIDNFLEGTPTSKFGEQLKEQVEERLRFYEEGTIPRKNIDVMHDVLEEVKKDGLLAEQQAKTEKKDKKKKKKEDKRKRDEPAPEPMEEEAPSTDKKKKKQKKQKEVAEPMEEEEPVPEKREKKKKTKKSA